MSRAHELELMMSTAIAILLVLNVSMFFGAGEGKKLELAVRSWRSDNIDHPRKHIVKSIQSEDGDIIDCIDIYKQPAFDHPALRNHTIQLTPSFDPTTESLEETQPSTIMDVSQLWKKHGSSCPKGTIPVRRTRERELLKGGGYGRKKPSFPVTQLNNKNSNFQQMNRSKAILVTLGYSYSAVKADIKVWNPNVESDDEYSLSLISLQSGPWYSFESVETGWAVNPGVYGDRETRLFLYWTTDASMKTGCFDVTCPGFIQTSNEIALGAAIYPVSTHRGLPYEITVQIFKDPSTNNLWVQYGEKTNLGYWPAELFSLLCARAETAQWGGEVYSPRLGHPPHTKTAMGSGRFADWQDWSGYMTRMRISDNSLVLRFPEWVSTYADEYFCYNVYFVQDYVDDPVFYYGGPGQSWRCP